MIAFHSLLAEFSTIRFQAFEPTLYEIGGFPHYENAASNVIAFFLDPLGPHGLGDLMLRSIVPNHPAPFSNVRVVRERSTNSGRIDLWIETDTHIFVVENKIFHSVDNPLSDYADHARVAAEREKKQVVRILLSLQPTEAGREYGFNCITHAAVASNVRSAIGDKLPKANIRYVLFLMDLLQTLDNLSQESSVNREFVDFVGTHEKPLQELLGEIRSLRAHLKDMAAQLGSLVDLGDLLQGVVSGGGSYQGAIDMSAVCYYDFSLRGGQLKFAVDARVSSHGWRFEIFSRNPQFTSQLESLIQNMQLPGQKGTDNRFEYARRFDLDASLEHVAAELSQLIRKLAADRNF